MLNKLGYFNVLLLFHICHVNNYLNVPLLVFTFSITIIIIIFIIEEFGQG